MIGEIIEQMLGNLNSVMEGGAGSQNFVAPWWFIYLKIFLGMFVLLLIFLIFVLAKKSGAFWKIEGWRDSFFGKKQTPPTADIKLNLEWAKIKEMGDSGREADMKLAIIEADKLFDDLLKRIGYVAEDMGGRLKLISPAQLSCIDDVWYAHKIRNQIAHQPDYQITSKEAQTAIDAFEQALRELEVLD